MTQLALPCVDLGLLPEGTQVRYGGQEAMIMAIVSPGEQAPFPPHVQHVVTARRQSYLPRVQRTGQQGRELRPAYRLVSTRSLHR